MGRESRHLDIAPMDNTELKSGPQLSEETLRAHEGQTRRQRLDNSAESDDKVPLDANSKPLSRRRSLIGFFGRTRSTRTAASAPQLRSVAEHQSPTLPGFRPSPDRSKTSVPLSSSPSPKSNTLLSPLSIQSRSSRNGRSKSTKFPRNVTSWDPPPLFQAYPQAVKHSNLPASTLESDFILKTRKRVANNANGQQDNAASDSPGQGGVQKQEDKNHRHKRTVSGSLSKAQWVRKIYVLVTSGYLLQYAGDGTFDRLPEKMMQLGKESVVFVSDAIPGKPWVLQISQTSSKDGEIIVETSRPFFSRLGLRNADTRRSTSNFLLVFDDLEEMESWLLVVRKEIEAFGGKIRSESPSQQPPPRPPPEHRLSQRYLVTRQSSHSRVTQNLTTPSSDRSKVRSIASSERSISDGRGSTETRPVQNPRNRYSWAPTEAPSLSTTLTSIDLEDSRDRRRSVASGASGFRQSYYSSSSQPSPTTSRFGLILPDLPPFDYPEAPYKLPSQHPATPTTSKDGEIDPMESNETLKKTSSQPNRATSPTTTNYSVPRFSKRFSIGRTSTDPLPTPPPSIRASDHTTCSRPPSQHSNGTDSKNRPLSTISDLPSPSTIIAPPLSSRLQSQNDKSNPVSTLILDDSITINSSNISPDEDRDDTTSSLHPFEAPHPNRMTSLPINRLDYTNPPSHMTTPSSQQLPSQPNPSTPPLDDHNDELTALPSLSSSLSSSRPHEQPKRRPMSLQPTISDYHPSSFLHPITSTTQKRRSHHPRPLYMNTSHSFHLKHPFPTSSSTTTTTTNSSSHQRSIPDLMAFGPPAPPPDCPLPALPPPLPRQSLLLPSQQQQQQSTPILRARQSLNIPPQQ